VACRSFTRKPVKNRNAGNQAGIWPEFGRNSAGNWPELGRKLAGNWPEIGRNLAGIWPEFSRKSCIKKSLEIEAKSMESRLEIKF